MRRLIKKFVRSKYSKQEREIIATVEQFGWLFRFVFDPDGVEPDFGYSVGFTKTLNAPEFIVFGLPKDLMHHMLSEVYEQVSAGRVPEDGMRWDDVLEGFQCISRRALVKDLHTKYTTAADWFWRNSGFSVGLAGRETRFVSLGRGMRARSNRSTTEPLETYRLTYR